MPDEKVYRALVLDDDESAREVLRDFLLPYGFEVTTFDDSREVFEHLEDELSVYDIFLFDINLPVIDGITLARRVRRNLELHTPVLFVSGAVSDDRAKTIQMLGCGYAYLEKGSFGQKELFNGTMSLIKESRIPVELGAVKKEMRDGFKEVNKSLEVLQPENLKTFVEEKVIAPAKLVDKRQLNEALRPSSVAKRWKTDPLVWTIVFLVCLIGGAIEEWLRYTYNMTNRTEKRVEAQEQMIQQIPQKIDRILDKVNENGGGS